VYEALSTTCGRADVHSAFDVDGSIESICGSIESICGSIESICDREHREHIRGWIESMERRIDRV
jgi:hypothetical protein